jgi:FkbH-like protein
MTSESTSRTELVKAQLRRESARAEASDPSTFLSTLGIECTIRHETDGSSLARIHELLARSNQMNLTTRRHDLTRLLAFLQDPDARMYSLCLNDCYADYGLVGAAIILGEDLESFVLSCRVMGLGAEDAFLRSVMALEAKRRPTGMLRASYIPTGRNMPCAGLLSANGFQEQSSSETVHVYTFQLEHGAPSPPAHCKIALIAETHPGQVASH